MKENRAKIELSSDKFTFNYEVSNTYKGLLITEIVTNNRINLSDKDVDKLLIILEWVTKLKEIPND